MLILMIQPRILESLTSLIKLTAFATFKICSKLNTLCCNYMHSFLQIIFFVAKNFFSSSRLAIIFTYQLTIIYSYQLRSNFDDKIDCKCSVKNLLRFFNSDIARGTIDKRLNNLQGILFFGLMKKQIILKMKITKGNLYLACFFIRWCLILYVI